MQTKYTTSIGVLASMAIILSYFEKLIPPLVPVPGIKLGLANIVVVIALYYLGTRPAFSISIIRVFVVALLFGGISTLMYSFTGGLVSFIGMYLLKKMKVFSIVGVSVFGACLHTSTQLLVASLVVENIKIMYYLPVLIFSSIIAGIIIGITAYFTLKNLN